eukprot:m.177822 g.177822  ORF g.177822 m.177822 type:complete len:520 (-) comp14916_c2_seq1:2767-4326(-)
MAVVWAATVLGLAAAQPASVESDSGGNIKLNVRNGASVTARRLSGSNVLQSADLFALASNVSNLLGTVQTLAANQAAMMQCSGQGLMYNPATSSCFDPYTPSIQSINNSVTSAAGQILAIVQCNAQGQLYDAAAAGCYDPYSNTTAALNQTTLTLMASIQSLVDCNAQGLVFDSNSSNCIMPYQNLCNINNGGCADSCTPTPPQGRQCSCSGGYTLGQDGASCIDTRTCANSPCHPGVQCTDAPGATPPHRCGSCPLGTYGNGSTCTTCSVCTAGATFLQAACTGTTDAVCLSCSACAAPLTEMTPCTGGQDRTCALPYNPGQRAFTARLTTFTLPPRVGTPAHPLNITLFGAGGGGNNRDHAQRGIQSGSGGMAQISVTTLPPTVRTLTVRVGAGGGRGTSNRCGGGGGGGRRRRQLDRQGAAGAGGRRKARPLSRRDLRQGHRDQSDPGRTGRVKRRQARHGAPPAQREADRGRAVDEGGAARADEAPPHSRPHSPPGTPAQLVWRPPPAQAHRDHL